MTRLAVAKLAWVELKLFVREPITVVFALALPVVLLYVLGSVFGNEASIDVYRGVGPMDYYIPAYVALVVASFGLISLPTHVAAYRDRGVLRRFRASGVSAWTVLGAEVFVTIVLSAVGAVVVVLAAAPLYDFAAPRAPWLVALGFVTMAAAFASLGVLLGAALPGARAAQAMGILLWFVLLFLGGAGPPREVLGDTLQRIQDATPLWHAVRVLQDGWLDLDPGSSWLVTMGILLVSLALVGALFRWE